MHFIPRAGDDAFYSDGWSEKQFDVDEAASKCMEWIGNNPRQFAGNDKGEAITGVFKFKSSILGFAS